MSDTPRADFRADVALSTAETPEFVSMRVLVNKTHILLRGNATKGTVRLGDIFDISQDVPGNADPDTTATVTLGFKDGEARETATIEARADTLAKFQLVVFKLLLTGIPVYLTQSTPGDDTSGDPVRGSLEVESGLIRFEEADRIATLPREQINGFETDSVSISDDSEKPTLAIDATLDGDRVRTFVRLPSYRRLNLFCRFLQSSPNAGRASSPARDISEISLLVVDDDPPDLEMIELMLTKLDDRFEITTVTSAPGAMRELETDAFDCIVSDYDMPGTDGIEFLEQVRESYGSIPFVLFTGQGSEAVAKQAIISDVTDYVEKGIGTDQYEILMARIEKAVR